MSKKDVAMRLPATLPNVNRFSYFFHRQIW